MQEWPKTHEFKVKWAIAQINLYLLDGLRRINIKRSGLSKFLIDGQGGRHKENLVLKEVVSEFQRNGWDVVFYRDKLYFTERN